MSVYDEHNAVQQNANDAVWRSRTRQLHLAVDVAVAGVDATRARQRDERCCCGDGVFGARTHVLLHRLCAHVRRETRRIEGREVMTVNLDD